MSISVLNTDAGLSGKTILNAEDPQTVSGNKTFTGNVTLTLVTSNLLFTDASYDIGASGATRPRDLWLSRNASIPGTLAVGGTLSVTGNTTITGQFTLASTQLFVFDSRSVISCPADGQLMFRNNAGSDFSRLMFGGTSAAYPALKRSSAALEVKLADDSGYAILGASALHSNAATGISMNNATDNTLTAVGSGTFSVISAGTTLLLASNGDVVVDLDNDNNGSNNFVIRNGADANAFVVSEAGAVSCGSVITAASTTAIPAGGSTGVFIAISSTAGFGVYVGSGAPTVSAPKGSLYLRSDGSSTSTRAYINTDGGTTWTAITTAA